MTTRSAMTDKGIVKPIVHSRTLLHVAIYALLMGVYAAIPATKEVTHFASYGDLPAEVHAALTLVLGWLLVFRTNAAYSRWWEARTLWGQLVNVSRNIAIKLNSLGNIAPGELSEARRLLIGFPPILRDHLRREYNASLGENLVPDSSTLDHLPSELVQRLYVLLNRWRANGQINDFDLRLIDEDAVLLLSVCGGCERIRNTRIVRSYRVFARQCVFLFLATFPWGIANDFRWWTIPLTIITAYFMLGLETVAEHVEEPFGYDEDDLDLDGLCDAISRSVNQIFERRNILNAWRS
ncbi:bestrophin family ion channel [Planctomicrobium sp. SH661]|uniref:bestrophin family ion channel n=1 Tax=Planctomicrobium sp. SH661 TaxID=3448124 RepID=UPI003F5C34F5